MINTIKLIGNGYTASFHGGSIRVSDDAGELMSDIPTWMIVELYNWVEHNRWEPIDE